MMKEKKESFTLKDWNKNDLPREKMILQGVDSLTVSELMTLILGSGRKGVSAFDMAGMILKDCNHQLSTLKKQTLHDLLKYEGVGIAKATTLMAAIELGKRIENSTALTLDKINGPDSVYRLMTPLLSHLDHEEFWVIFLNNSNKVVHKMQLSKGGITATLVDIRLLLRKALEVAAISIVLCHNHPSGNNQPSRADIEITEKIIKAASVFDIRVIDHLIITDHGFFSFASENKL